MLQANAMPESKGYNQGYNQKVTTSQVVVTPHNNQEKQTVEVFLTVKRCCNLLGVSQQAFSKRVKKGRDTYTTRQVRGNGGMRYEIALHSLSVDAQNRYWEERASAALSSGDHPQSTQELLEEHTAPSSPTLEFATKDSDAVLYAGLEPYNKALCDRNLAIITAVGRRKGKEAKVFVEGVWNIEHPDQTLSFKSFQRIKLAHKKSGISGICGHHGTRKNDSTIQKQWWEVFMSAYGGQKHKTSVRSCYEIVCGFALNKGDILTRSEFPSVSAFRKRLEREPQAALQLARNGKDAYKKTLSYSLDIDENSISAGDIFVGDHAVFDIFVALPDGTLIRPWISAISDYKTNMVVGYVIFCGNPNGEKIILSLHSAISRVGKPKKLLFDNGKDYRRKDIGGGRIKQTSKLIHEFEPTIVNVLDIEVHYAIPYNSQSKPIERVFGVFREYFDKHIDGYTGPDGKNRPDVTRKIEKSMAKMRKNMTSKQLKEIQFSAISFEKFEVLAEQFIDTYNKRPFIAGKFAGKSPIQIWTEDKPEMRGVLPEELGIICASSGNPVKVNRMTLRDTRSNRQYYANWMTKYAGSDTYFWLRINPAHPEVAYAFEARVEGYNNRKPIYSLGKFIATAKLKPKVEMYGDDREVLEEQLQFKRHTEKEVQRMVKKAVGFDLPLEDKMTYMNTAVTAAHNENCAAAGVDNEVQAPKPATITPFSHVPRMIEMEESNGVWNPAIVELSEKEKKGVIKPQFKRWDNE